MLYLSVFLPDDSCERIFVKISIEGIYLGTGNSRLEVEGGLSKSGPPLQFSDFYGRPMK